jgi:beta-xylosidase/AraC-like DNA-binding protein
MQTKDLILINAAKRHSWIAKSKQHLVCEINIDYQMLSTYLERDFLLFWCNSIEEYSESYNILRNLVFALIKEYAMDTKRMSFQAQAVYYQIVDLLLKAFMVDSSISSGSGDKEEMTYRVVQYIHANYQRRISLEEIAREFYSSTSTLSRQFKARIGMNFVDYINEVRLQSAVDKLLFGNQPITTIAADSGYSNLSLFNRAFKKKYQTTPSGFQKQMKNSAKTGVEEKSRAEHQDIKVFLEHLSTEPGFDSAEADLIPIDVRDVGKKQRYGCNAVYMGHASLLLLSSFQRHTLLLKNELGFEYLQVRNLLSYDMRIRSSSKSSDLNFEQVNNVLDFLVENRIIPMIDLGEEATTIQIDQENLLLKEEHEVFYHSPQDADYVIRRFIRHIVTRYGQDEVDRWMFHCLYDVRTERIPEGTRYSYVDTVANVIGIVRESLPGAKVGVFGHSFELENHVLLRFLEELADKGALPGFLLLTVPPYRYQDGRHVHMPDAEHMCIQIEKCRKALRDGGFGELLIFLHGWNTTYSDRSFFNDSCAKGALVVTSLLAIQEQVDLVIYDYGSDISSVHYDQHALLIGGRGLLTKDGLRKPVCYALRYLRRTTGQLLVRGKYFVASTNGKGEYYILLCNHKRFSYQYFLKEEHEWGLHEIDMLYENTEDRLVQVRLTNLENQSYSIRRYVIDEEHVGLISQWQRLGGREIQTKEEIDYLGGILVPKLSVEYRTVLCGEIELELRMKVHDVMFIEIAADRST